MPIRLERRSFITLASGVTLLGWGAPLAGPARPALRASGRGQGEAPVYAGYPAHDPEVVREVVSVAHGNLDRLRELVEARPELSKAAWDWGFGDWESALGAAAHTGSREIAMLLIEHGARPTIFSAAMLGQLAVVRAFVEASPGLQNLPGPHGIPLHAHARAGGEPAREVHEYLEEIGYEERGPERVDLDDSARELHVGEYAFGDAADERFVVSIHERLGLRIERPEVAIPRGLIHLGDHTFYPAGAPSVRIRFDVHEGRSTELVVLDPDIVVRARRVDP